MTPIQAAFRRSFDDSEISESEYRMELVLSGILKNDPVRWEVMRAVRDLDLPDCWIAGGFVRSVVWDLMHGVVPAPIRQDIDVLYYGPTHRTSEWDDRYTATLRYMMPQYDWSVKNQLRMHTRNGDLPYRSTWYAVAAGPETCTVGVRRTWSDEVAILAPHGLSDLLGLVLRPAQPDRPDSIGRMRDRIVGKGWLDQWPLLRIEGMEL